MFDISSKNFFKARFFSRVPVYFLTLCVCVKILIKSSSFIQLLRSIISSFIGLLPLYPFITQLFVETWPYGNQCNCLCIFLFLKMHILLYYYMNKRIISSFQNISLHFPESGFWRFIPFAGLKGRKTDRKEGRLSEITWQDKWEERNSPT